MTDILIALGIGYFIYMQLQNKPEAVKPISKSIIQPISTKYILTPLPPAPVTVTSAPVANPQLNSFPAKWVQINTNNHSGSDIFSIPAKGIVYYYFKTVFPVSKGLIPIMLQGKTNNEPDADMLVRYAGVYGDNILPTIQDMDNVIKYQALVGVSVWNNPPLNNWSPARYREDLYYNIVGNSFELITIGGQNGYPKGYYYIMIVNKGNTTGKYSLNYSEIRQ